MYLPQVTDNGSVCPGMLCVQSHGAIFENNQVKGFIKPPVKETWPFSLFMTEQKPNMPLHLPTCRSTFHEADTWRNCPETQQVCWCRSAALCHPGLRRRLPSQWRPETACSYRGWSKHHEHWPMESCRTNQISKWRKTLGQECFLTVNLFPPYLNSSDSMLAL